MVLKGLIGLRDKSLQWLVCKVWEQAEYVGGMKSADYASWELESKCKVS